MTDKKIKQFKEAGLINVKLNGSCRWVTPSKFNSYWKGLGYKVIDDEVVVDDDSESDRSLEEITAAFEKDPGSLKVPELKLYAEYEGFEIPSSGKSAIIEAIQTAKAAK